MYMEGYQENIIRITHFSKTYRFCSLPTIFRHMYKIMIFIKESMITINQIREMENVLITSFPFPCLSQISEMLS